MTTVLDVLGLLAVAGGVFFAAEPVLGWAAVAPAGVTVLAGSALAEWLDSQREKRLERQR